MGKKTQQSGGKNQGNGGHKVEEKSEAKNEEKKNNNNGNKEVVLKVYIHCEGCAKKAFNCLRGFEGVEEIVIENANHKVIVKGKNVDPMKVLVRLQKKYSRNVELISPKPKTEDVKEKKVEQKKEEPKMKIIVLKMYMHCEGCALDIKRNIVRMEGIMSVEPDMKKSIVVIKGIFDPPKLVQKISKRLGKHVEIVKQETQDKGNGKNEAQKKEKKEENALVYPPQYHINYIDPSFIFSDENVFSCSIM
ncbi:heavy metal-associated isoprenylated plant protein 8 [Mercurialis annua]|uniref:heavy metal-associated isoprenylated plant protein 8 n=1 Tax=Mercurialis annua TaxID=3986 RepID=UPI00215E253F|nr:heavy metal-associated isoprenylated plant protein 8 [Mercurialis annua]